MAGTALLLAGIGRIVIGAGPFPDIAGHVAQTQRVRLVGSDRRGDRLTVVQGADGRAGWIVAVGKVGITGVDVVTPVITGGGAGTGGILPFGLGG